MMRVQNAATAVEVIDPVRMVKRQEQTIKELKQELLMHDALADRSGVAYDPYTPEQRNALAAQLQAYLQAGEDDEGALQRALTAGAGAGAMTGGLGETMPAMA